MDLHDKQVTLVNKEKIVAKHIRKQGLAFWMVQGAYQNGTERAQGPKETKATNEKAKKEKDLFSTDSK